MTCLQHLSLHWNIKRLGHYSIKIYAVTRGTVYGLCNSPLSLPLPWSRHFLPALLECESDPMKLGDTFESAEEHLRIYITYCKDKSQSESLYQEFSSFFEEIRSQLRDRLNLPNYLILPVQRITKYNLLLADFNKNSIRAGLETGNIDVALRVTRGISTQANNAVHLSLLEGVEERKLGKLVLQVCPA